MYNNGDMITFDPARARACRGSITTQEMETTEEIKRAHEYMRQGRELVQVWKEQDTRPARRGSETMWICIGVASLVWVGFIGYLLSN